MWIPARTELLVRRGSLVSGLSSLLLYFIFKFILVFFYMVRLVVKFQISPWTVETQVGISQKLSFFSICYLLLGLYWGGFLIWRSWRRRWWRSPQSLRCRWSKCWLMRGWFGCNNGKPRILSEFEAQDEECFWDDLTIWKED